MVDRRFTLLEYRFSTFCSCDLDLDLMTFIYELDPHSLKIRRMCQYALSTSRLSKAIIWHWQTYRQTDRQTDRQTRPKLYTTPLRGWSKIDWSTTRMRRYFVNLPGLICTCITLWSYAINRYWRIYCLEQKPINAAVSAWHPCTRWTKYFVQYTLLCVTIVRRIRLIFFVSELFCAVLLTAIVHSNMHPHISSSFMRTTTL